MITPSLFNGPLLETVLLRTFMEVVDSGSFVTAAEHLSLTPSAVSGHIKRLEQIADTTLLLRTTRRLTLTEAGKSYIPMQSAFSILSARPVRKCKARRCVARYV